ncbi:MAG: hypothetical protein ACFFAS_15645 [Promethearchaeota archaeon]
MKHGKIAFLGAFFMLSLVFLSNLSLVAAEVEPGVVDIQNGDTIQTKLEAHNKTTYRFRYQTRLTINCSQDCEVNIYCNALQIGTKYFELEIETGEKLEINMTCNEEEAELGLIKGNAYTARNRNRYVYQEGFCISLECNGSFSQARLKIRVTAQNREGSWAYHDNSTGEWATVPTHIQDGFLVASTTHFSTWTVLIPESTSLLPYIITGAAVIMGVIAAIGFVAYKKKR